LAISIEKVDVIVFPTNPDFACAGLEVGLSLLTEFFICGRADLDTDVRCRRCEGRSKKAECRSKRLFGKRSRNVTGRDVS
jgi:hypothetical protein